MAENECAAVQPHVRHFDASHPDRHRSGSSIREDAVQMWSPSESVKNFKTPTLVVHGDMDFCVPVGEACRCSRRCKKMKVPSEYLNFPEEGHWVGKPQNSLLWYKTVIGWWDPWQKK
jgi:dipeptidyl aminopeptidase/acylaminoacyl peptidase